MIANDSLFATDRASLLRVYLGESDQIGKRPAYEAILESARKHGLAGATVFRGSGGFGANSIIHHASPWRLSQDRPILIEIVDVESKVQAYLDVLQELLQGGGLVTLEPVRIVRYRAEGEPTEPEGVPS